MAEAGILRDKERVELIEGEIVQMAPIGTRHFGCVINVNRLCVARLGDRAVVSPQGPVVIAPRSEPQPDLALLRPRAVPYSRGLPTPEDVLLGGRGGGYDRPLRPPRQIAPLRPGRYRGVLAVPGHGRRRGGPSKAGPRRLRQRGAATAPARWSRLWHSRTSASRSPTSSPDGAYPGADPQRLRRFPDRRPGACLRSQSMAPGVASHASPRSTSQIIASSRLPGV